MLIGLRTAFGGGWSGEEVESQCVDCGMERVLILFKNVKFKDV